MRGICSIYILVTLGACGDNLTPNRPPELPGFALTAVEDTPTSQTLAASDPDGDALVVVVGAAPVHGTAAVAGTTLTYAPQPNFTGSDQLSVVVSDGTNEVTAVVDVTVTPVNDAPVGGADSIAASEDTARVVPQDGLLANDSDPDGDPLSITAVANPQNGTVSITGTDVTFVPTANFVGAGSFEYTLSDGTETATVVVSVEIGGKNDPPVAVDDAGATAEDTAVDFAGTDLVANDTDADGDLLTVTAVADPTNGTVALNGSTVTFTPAADFNGTATFTYTVSDGVATDTGVVTVTVAAANDAPVAVDDSATTAEDTPITLATLTANDVDVEADPLTVTAVTNATNGTVALNGGSPTFTPDANFSGTASFEYTVSDGTLTDTGLVTITVTAVNDPPVAVDDVAIVQAGGSIDIPQATLLANDSDGGDGNALSITSVTNAVNGTVSLAGTTVHFTPDAGFEGTAAFDYVVSDGTDTDTGTVAVTVTTAPVCGDNTIASPETCDDGNPTGGDGCSASCQIETGFTCTGTPSTCTPICGDGLQVTGEACDDGNPDNTDGCTTACVVGVVCIASDFAGASRVTVDAATGHCYVGFDGVIETWQAAETACEGIGGHLPVVTTAGENAVVRATSVATDQPWLGGNDLATEGTFAWVTREPFAFAPFDPGQPDDGLGNEDCLHMFDATRSTSGSDLVWNDSNCTFLGFVTGRVCELEQNPCGDSLLQLGEGEECDDGNRTAGDGCDATCQLEVGCGNGVVDPGEECDDGNIVPTDSCSFPTCQVLDGCGDGNLDAGEQCDDDNTTSGDGCSSTCTLESLVHFTFTSALGDEVTFPADSADAGLASVPAMSRGAGVTASAAGGTFSGAAWTSTATLDATDFFSFTLTPAAGTTMTLQVLELDERRSATGIRSWSVRSSLDGFATDLQVFAVPDDTATRLDQRVVLTTAFANVSVPVEFRIFGFAAEASTGTWRLDNVDVFGFTTP